MYHVCVKTQIIKFCLTLKYISKKNLINRFKLQIFNGYKFATLNNKHKDKNFTSVRPSNQLSKACNMRNLKFLVKIKTDAPRTFLQD